MFINVWLWFLFFPIMMMACFIHWFDCCDSKDRAQQTDQKFYVDKLLKDWKRVIRVRHYRGNPRNPSPERKDDEGIYPIPRWGCINLRLPPPRPVLEPVLEPVALPASDAVPVAIATSVVTESNNIVLNV